MPRGGFDIRRLLQSRRMCLFHRVLCGCFHLQYRNWYTGTHMDLLNIPWYRYRPGADGIRRSNRHVSDRNRLELRCFRNPTRHAHSRSHSRGSSYIRHLQVDRHQERSQVFRATPKSLSMDLCRDRFPQYHHPSHWRSDLGHSNGW